jgi:hypothetical protein
MLARYGTAEAVPYKARTQLLVFLTLPYSAGHSRPGWSFEREDGPSDNPLIVKNHAMFDEASRSRAMIMRWISLVPS